MYQSTEAGLRGGVVGPGYADRQINRNSPVPSHKLTSVLQSIDQIFPNRVCGVLRTQDSDAGFQACLAAMEGGIRTIEVTKTVPSCFEMIRGLIATTFGRYPVGVGTVWDPGAVREAKDAGASFVVTPVLLPEVAEACRQEGILCVLGALTPTEIYQARLAGAALVKVFPIDPVGGPEYIRALNGPMRGVPFWVSGGVEIEDIGAYLRLGVKAVGLTTALFPPEALAHRDFDLIRNNAQRATEAAAAAIGD
jgi:2-dehydro-3-deoxyphosphogluconate aldolase/(4S)-4-hydroxy-2-oxoglutarate aldolase